MRRQMAIARDRSRAINANTARWLHVIAVSFRSSLNSKAIWTRSKIKVAVKGTTWSDARRWRLRIGARDISTKIARFFGVLGQESDYTKGRRTRKIVLNASFCDATPQRLRQHGRPTQSIPGAKERERIQQPARSDYLKSIYSSAMLDPRNRGSTSLTITETLDSSAYTGFSLRLVCVSPGKLNSPNKK